MNDYVEKLLASAPSIDTWFQGRYHIEMYSRVEKMTDELQLKSMKYMY